MGISSYLEGWDGLGDRGEYKDDIHHKWIHTELGHGRACWMGVQVGGKKCGSPFI